MYIVHVHVCYTRYLVFTVASIGFSEPAYTAMEDGGSVRVCLQLCEGSLNRPIDVLLYTDDGTALGENYHTNLRHILGAEVVPSPSQKMIFHKL